MSFRESIIDAASRLFGVKPPAERAHDLVREFEAFYEGAMNDRLFGSQWMTQNMSADSAVEMDLPDLRKRSRELYRDDSLGGSVESRVQHTVGRGFTIQSRIRPVTNLINDEEANAWNTELEELWLQVAPQIGVSRKESFWQIQSLCKRALDTDGEFLVVISDTPSDTPLTMSLEVVDVDRLETPPEDAMNPRIRMGVETDANKRIVAYHIRTTHPNDNKEIAFKYQRVPAERVCHGYHAWFAGQSRGLPWMTRALKRAKYGSDLGEAALIHSQIANAWAAFVRVKGSPPGAAKASATGLTPDKKRTQKVEAGTINFIKDAEEITFSQPPNTGPTTDLINHNDRRTSAALNWPYELAMGDWRGMSHAGGRIVLRGAQLSTQCEQLLLTESLVSPVWKWFANVAISLQLVSVPPASYTKSTRWQFLRHEAVPPRWGYSLNPGEEIKATLEAIDGNLMTLKQAHGESQLESEDILRQRQIERATERAYEILPTRSVQVENPQGLNPQEGNANA